MVHYPSRKFSLALSLLVIFTIYLIYQVSDDSSSFTRRVNSEFSEKNISQPRIEQREAKNRCELPWWESMSECNSTAKTVANQTHTTRSHCSQRADALGSGQKVISYCLFGNYFSYALGFAETLEKIKQSYPGWVVRLYTEPQKYTKELLPLQVRYPNLYICDVVNLPGGIRDVTGVDPRLWRVAVLGDELVEVFLSRDLDAMMIDREVEATEEFLKSGKALHVMRDHVGHHFPILTGMFGVNQTASNMSLLNSIRNNLFAARDTKGNDQKLLKEHLLPKLSSSMIAHDSYYCMKYPGTVPFPTRRVQGQFVGNRRYRKKYAKESINNACPTKCRPSKHQDWNTC